MSIQINPIGATTASSLLGNKTTQQSNGDFNAILNGELNDEDKTLYNELKSAGVDLSTHSLEWHKQHIKSLGFPPITAPSAVKKAWNEELAKLSPEQQEQVRHDVSVLWLSATYNDPSLEKAVTNYNFSYRSLINNFSSSAEAIAKKSSQCFNNYGLINSFLDSFKANLDS